jgi:integrase
VNRTLALIRYAKLNKGWRRGSVVLQPNGKIKHPCMVYSGVETLAPQGRYQIRRCEGKNPIYIDIGDNPTDALNRFRAEQGKQDARIRAVEAGWAVEAPESVRHQRAVRPKMPVRKTLKQYAEEFLEMHRNLPHRSDDSVRVYTSITSSFQPTCKAEYPDQITKEDVIRWHATLRQKYSDRTCADRYLSLRGFLRYCGLKPSAIIPQGTHTLLRKYTKKRPNTYTREQVQALIDASLDQNRALLWEFAYKTGLRDSELQAVTRYDLHGLDGDNPMLCVKERAEYRLIKDAEERQVEIHPGIVPKLKQWLRDNPKRVLLFGTDTDKPDTKMLLALKVTARNAGLNCGRCKGCLGERNECGEYTLHRFRRTYVTRMLRATGGDLRSVMDRSGHSDIKSVMRYLEPAAVIREAVAIAF